MKPMVTIALMLLSSQAPTRQTDESLGTELHETYKAWFAAVDRGDGAAVDALEVDDFILVGAAGMIMEKHRSRVTDPWPFRKRQSVHGPTASSAAMGIRQY
jgi:hypothetical protein